MDRFGLFVDAGYLLAAGGQLCLGEKKRNKFEVAYQLLHEELVHYCANDCKLPLFRTYWYDGGFGSPQPQPTTDQLKIAALSNVKLRLGRIIHGQQKGVDSMLTRDMMTLARERAMPVAYLVSGDEDLREAVVAAQDLGVQVVLVGIEAVKGLVNQSFTLINECDSHIVLPREFWIDFFSSPQVLPQPPIVLQSPISSVAAAESEEEVAKGLGGAFCNSWAGEAGVDTVKLVLAGQPSIPKDVDGPLLRYAESYLGSLRTKEGTRQIIRGAFLARLEEWLAESESQQT